MINAMGTPAYTFKQLWDNVPRRAPVIAQVEGFPKISDTMVVRMFTSPVELGVFYKHLCN